MSHFQLTEIATVLKDYKVWTPHHTFGGLHFDDSALEPDGNGVRIREDGQGIDPTMLTAGGRAGHWGLADMR